VPVLCEHQSQGETLTVEPDSNGSEAAQKITERIGGLEGWKGETLGWVRQLILDADPDVVEEWKWEKPTSGGVPVWSHDGIICTGEVYQKAVKLTFMRGASLPDPKKIFNSSLGGNTRRAIDIAEDNRPDEEAFKDLIRSAVAANVEARAKKK
jgi:hypothetical protein